MKKILLTAFAALVSISAFAQSAPRVSISIPKTAKPGEAVKGTVTVVFEAGLHGYQNPPSQSYMIPLKIESATKGVTLKSIKYPKGDPIKVAGEDAPVMVYEGLIKIPVVLVMPKKAGKVDLSLKVKYQQCNESACYPPAEEKVASSIVLKAGGKK